VKYEEAIITCQMVCADCEKNHIFTKCIEELCANYAKIKALEKQITQKCVEKVFDDEDEETGEKYKLNFYLCPVCSELISVRAYQFCPYCGQALKRE